MYTKRYSDVQVLYVVLLLYISVLVQVLLFCLLQLLQMDTAEKIAFAMMIGGFGTMTAAAIANGAANIGPVRENGVIVGVEVAVPVSLPAFAVGAAVGGLAAGAAKIIGMW